MIECDHCGQNFFTKYALKCHIFKVHLKNTSNNCNLCDNKTQILDKHKTEEPSKTIIKLFKCPECSFTTKNKNTLQRHKNLHEKIGACPVCHKQFLNKINFKNHLESKSQDHKIECSLCKKKFVNDMCLRYHYLTHVGFKCKDCCKWFISTRNFRLHTEVCVKKKPVEIQQQNDVVIIWKCEYCNHKFKSIKLLEEHLDIFHLKIPKTQSFECKVCQAKFETILSLKHHKRDQHNLKDKDEFTNNLVATIEINESSDDNSIFNDENSEEQLETNNNETIENVEKSANIFEKLETIENALEEEIESAKKYLELMITQNLNE